MKAWLKFLLLILGFILGFTGLTTPIHEFGHVLASILIGGGGYIESWGLASVEYGGTPFVSFAGVGFHMLFFAFLATFRRKAWLNIGVGGFLGVFVFAIGVQGGSGSDRSFVQAWVFITIVWGILMVAGIIAAQYDHYRHPKGKTKPKPPKAYTSPLDQK